MANTKTAKSKTVAAAVENTETKVETSEAAKTGPSYDELAALVKSLSAQVAELSKARAEEEKTSSNDKLGELVNVMTSRKSDKEITIVHCCEVAQGLTTHIKLSTLSIDMRTVGEERTLTWSQFEELVSKYHSFFDRGIIKVGSDYQEIAERYNVPCVSDEMGKVKLTHADIDRLPGMTPRELEDFVNTLNENDKNTVISYCLGKCYTRERGFYDRYKMEALGRLAKNEAFAGLILILNDEEVRAMQPTTPSQSQIS